MLKNQERIEVCLIPLVPLKMSQPDVSIVPARKKL